MTGPSRESILARFTRRKPSKIQLAQMETSLEVFHEVAEYILDHTPAGREQAAALTALQEAKFWTNEAIVTESPARSGSERAFGQAVSR